MSDYVKGETSDEEHEPRNRSVMLTASEEKAIAFMRANEIRLNELWDLAPHAPHPNTPPDERLHIYDFDL